MQQSVPHNAHAIHVRLHGIRIASFQHSESESDSDSEYESDSDAAVASAAAFTSDLIYYTLRFRERASVAYFEIKCHCATMGNICMHVPLPPLSSL